MSTIRLHSVVVDVPRRDHERTVTFWAAATGVDPVASDKHPDYARFADVTPGCHLLVQATGEASPRVHLDFATSDREGAVERLSALGARPVNGSNPWTVMRDPAGLLFCICPVDGCDGSDG